MSKNKGKFKEFIQKAGNVFPEILDIGTKAVTGNWGGAIQEVGDLLFKKQKSGNPEVSKLAGALLVEYERDRENFVLEGFRLQIDDRKDARRLYLSDSLLQKILAIVFTIAYFGLSYALINHFFIDKGVLEEYELGFLSTLFGAMSAKVNTIIDFFFGGSVKNNKDEV